MKVFNKAEKTIYKEAGSFREPTVAGALWKGLLWAIAPIHWVIIHTRIILLNFDANASLPQKAKDRAEEIKSAYIVDVEANIESLEKKLRQTRTKISRLEVKLASAESKKKKKEVSERLRMVADIERELSFKLQQNQALLKQLMK